jgi:membrane fusion protein (multidrug efflux system)
MRATAISASADADKSRAAYAASVQQQNVTARTRGQLLAVLAKTKAALSLAKQNLEHTIIRAPVSGQIGDRQAQTGEFVSPGTQLLTIVPMDTIYVTANFKETQTARMLVGQHVRLTIDALPGKTFDGDVESFAPASGSEFSLLPFEPATGNFTRIVQRVPVRVRILPGQDGHERLRPGLSADVTVDLQK